MLNRVSLCGKVISKAIASDKTCRITLSITEEFLGKPKTSMYKLITTGRISDMIRDNVHLNDIVMFDGKLVLTDGHCIMLAQHYNVLYSPEGPTFPAASNQMSLF